MTDRTNLDVAADAITEELQANSMPVTFDDGEGFGFDVAEDTVASWLAPVVCKAIHPALAHLTPDDVAAIFATLDLLRHVPFGAWCNWRHTGDESAARIMDEFDTKVAAIPAHAWEVLSK